MAKHDLDDIFQALADPTRRDVIARLSSAQVLSVGILAERYDMALPSFMKHIAVLETCGLIETAKQGRVRHCRIATDRLSKAADWINDQRVIWEDRTDRLAAFIETEKDTT